MTNRLATFTATAALLPSLAIACAGDVLQFDSTNSQGVIDNDAIVAELSEAQARTLCQTLPKLGPGNPAGPLPPDVAETSADYRIGTQGGTACVVQETKTVLSYMPLHGDDCVANVRHGPCQATVGALMDCVRFYADRYESGYSCPEAAAACAEFEAGADCNETVLQNSFVVNAEAEYRMGTDCYALPIKANAKRPICAVP